MAETQRLPRLLFEDHMLRLRGTILLAWICLGLAVFTPFGIDAWHRLPWPETGDFALVYYAVLVEFGLNTLALTALLYSTDWYERVPRESAQRVRWLLMFVIFWFSLHIFAVFHITGAMKGPLLPLVPVLFVAALAAFPGKQGWLLAAYLLMGFAAVVALASNQLLASPGSLARHFEMGQPLSAWASSALAIVFLAAAMLAVFLRRQMFMGGADLNPLRRVDLETGLFRKRFLQHRLGMELGRIERQGDAAVLLLIALQDATPSQIRQAGQTLISQIRLSSDTPAVYEEAVICVLLAGADAAALTPAADRIVTSVAKSLGEGGQARLKSSAAILKPQANAVQRCQEAAEQALARAQYGHSTVVA
ncbi:MAG: hypothetical protein ACPHER_08720 [Nevskiales bacterium]